MWSDNGGIITLIPNGENPQEGRDTDLRGGCRRRWGRYVCGVIHIQYDTGAVPGGRVPINVAQTGQAPRKLHEQSLKVQGIYTSGGTNTTTAVP